MKMYSLPLGWGSCYTSKLCRDTLQTEIQTLMYSIVDEH